MRLELFPLVLAVLSLSSSMAGAAAPPPVYPIETVKDIDYYTGPDHHKVKHKLDLYLPKGQKDFPVLFFVHGGGWASGDKNYFGVYSTLASAFARRGIGVVVANYRLSPGVEHPEHIKDVARAFAWTAKTIAKHGGRADRIFVCGHSAGAHLVALLTTEERWLKDHGLSTKDIRGAIPISGPFVIPDGLMARVFGKEKGIGPKVSPITHVRAGLPPFLILVADKDLRGCDKKVAEAFYKALEGKKSPAELVEIKESDHIRILLSASANASLVQRSIMGFIQKHAGGGGK